MFLGINFSDWFLWGAPMIIGVILLIWTLKSHELGSRKISFLGFVRNKAIDPRAFSLITVIIGAFLLIVMFYKENDPAVNFWFYPLYITWVVLLLILGLSRVAAKIDRHLKSKH